MSLADKSDNTFLKLGYYSTKKAELANLLPLLTTFKHNFLWQQNDKTKLQVPVIQVYIYRVSMKSGEFIRLK